ncbi:MAG: LysR family transcriptional regulator [Proteobacteria bacterium]|nr:LysR family transcriptional regulator [Pseudomonadota bacterium]MCP4918547.1 LysR family transcriptional regulator [Pseudomonadota bacterium]
MDWNDLRHFLALAREGSVRAAGASLGVSHSTVLRRVEALETQLKARLFDRNRDGYTLTDAGQQMLPGAERIEREMATLERGLVGQDERLAGTVALTCCDNFVARLVLGELASFCEEHPEIELSFTADSRSFDLSKREADIAIRTKARNASPPEHLIGMKVAPVCVAAYVAVAHEDRLDPETGSAPRWLAFEDRKVHAQMTGLTPYAHLPAWGAFNSLELGVDAALQGLGLAMLPTYVGDAESGLRRLPRVEPVHVADLWMLCHPDLKANARFRATRAAVADALRSHRALFAGCAGAPDGPEIAPEVVDEPLVR